MKKMLVLGLTAFLLIAFSSCQFNLFAALDRIEIPSSSDLNSKASSDPDGFMSDVEDYLESGSITDDNINDVLGVLEGIYSNPPDVETGQEAALLAGEVSLESNPDTVVLMDNVVGILIPVLSNEDPEAPELTANDLVASIFTGPEEGFHDVFVSLKSASGAYSSFASSIDADGDGVVDDINTAAPGVADEEKVDLAIYAVVSIIAADLGEKVLYDLVYNDVEPSGDLLNDSMELKALLQFAGLDSLLGDSE